MPDLPHDGLAAGLGQAFHQRKRALDLEDDGSARLFLEDLAGQHERQDVAHDHAAQVVHDADAIGVTVEADADVGSRLQHLGLQGHQVLLHRRVGMVVGEVAVHFAEERDDLAAQLLQLLASEERSSGVGGIQHHPGLAAIGTEGEVLAEPLAVVAHEIVLAVAALARAPLAAGGDGEAAADLLAMERAVADAQLEAVVFLGIVAGGDHHRTVHRQVEGRVIGHRRGDGADVRHVHAAIPDTAHEGRLDAGTGGAHIHAHGAGAAAGFDQKRGVGAADGVDRIVAQLGLHEATDVVFAKDGRFELHFLLSGSLRRRPPQVVAFRTCAGKTPVSSGIRVPGWAE